MSELIAQLGNSGTMGVILAIMIWDNIKMKNKLFTVIENNTKALERFTGDLSRASKE